MKKSYVFFIVLCSVLIVFVSACNNSSTPSGPEPTPQPTATLTGMYIYGDLSSYENRESGTTASIQLLHGNSQGSPVANATVTINGTALSYDAATNTYINNTISLIAVTDPVSLAISCTAGTASASTTMPYTPAITNRSDGDNIQYDDGSVPYMIPLDFTITADPDAFEIEASKMNSNIYLLAGGSGDLRSIDFSPALTGYGDVTMTVKALNSTAVTGAVSGSYFSAENWGGDVILYMY